MGSGGVAIAALPAVTCLKVPFSDGLGGGYMSKETNWKQKFQKPINENVCLTYLNGETNGNFHFLSFGMILIRGDWGVIILNIAFASNVLVILASTWYKIT